ncbi:MAG TPA: hypothetical protein VM432_00765 [Bdellovibrionales bacterium]|nr:hypothetical protein [Bdellovibrionales bacterium]
MSQFNPRLPSSTKWTDVPAEFLAKVVTVFVNQFDIEAANGEFIADGRIYPEEVVLRVGYLEKGRLKQVNFEASMDIKGLAPEKSLAADAEAVSAEEKSDTMDRLFTCIDAIGSMMEEYFEVGDEEELDVPLYWKEFEFEGETVFLQHSTANTRLEDEADRILGLLAEDLVRENQESEDALVKAEIDSELAAEVQKLIREGKHPLQQGDKDSEDLN